MLYCTVAYIPYEYFRINTVYTWWEFRVPKGLITSSSTTRLCLD